MRMRAYTMSTVREGEALFRQQLEDCGRLSERHPRDDVVSKALASAQKAVEQLTRCDKSVLLASSPAQQALQTYCQSVLDSTYHRECRLIEGDFPDDVARHEISVIIDSISKPVSLCGSVEDVQPTLGTDQYECINWRVGALLYMYVHELMASDSRKEAAGRAFVRECCVVGMCHLGLMLSARAPLDPREACSAHDSTHDSALPQLLQEGIFSDIHMLALMYAGEMCYWAWELGNRGRGNCDRGKVEQVTQTGEEEKGEVVGRERQRRTEECSRVGESSNGGELQVAQTREGGTVAAPPLFGGLISLMKGSDYLEHYFASFSAADEGQSLLGRYIKLAQGPLKAQNWNYARAVQLVVQLKRACS